MYRRIHIVSANSEIQERIKGDASCPDAEDIATIIFTSGTTGKSQGVMPVSYTHLDVYKRQRPFCMSWKYKASGICP